VWPTADDNPGAASAWRSEAPDQIGRADLRGSADDSIDNNMSRTNGRRQPSRHVRGYGSVHDARRRQVTPLVNAGKAVCSRCGGPISPGERWHLDHSDDRQTYIGVAHEFCNLQAAGIKTAQLRNASSALRWSRIWFEPVPPGTTVGGVVYGDNGQPRS
jgi:hypothetical protein